MFNKIKLKQIEVVLRRQLAYFAFIKFSSAKLYYTYTNKNNSLKSKTIGTSTLMTPSLYSSSSNTYALILSP